MTKRTTEKKDERERVVECERNRSAGVKQDVVGHQYALRQWELISVGACGLVLLTPSFPVQCVNVSLSTLHCHSISQPALLMDRQ